MLSFFTLTTGCTYDEYLPEEEPVIVDTVSFADDILPIFNEGCNTPSCHNTGGVAPDLSPGVAYNALIDGGFINVSSPDESELLEWMRGNRRFDMPLDGPNQEWNATVLAWIKQGALNN
jgi:hypothetical protein